MESTNMTEKMMEAAGWVLYIGTAVTLLFVALLPLAGLIFDIH